MHILCGVLVRLYPNILFIVPKKNVNSFFMDSNTYRWFIVIVESIDYDKESDTEILRGIGLLNVLLVFVGVSKQRVTRFRVL